MLLSHMAASERFLIKTRLRHATPCLPLHPPPSTLPSPLTLISTPSSHFPLPFVPSFPLFSCFSLTSPLSLFSSFPPRSFVLTVLHQVSAPHQARILFPLPPPFPSLAPAPSSPILPHPFPSSPLFPSSRVSSARLAARNPSLHFLISSFLMRHRSAHCAHPLAFRCRSLLSQLWLRLRRSLLFSLAALALRLPSEK